MHQLIIMLGINMLLIASSYAGQMPGLVHGQDISHFELKSVDNTTYFSKQLLENGHLVIEVLRGWPGYQCPICTVQVGKLIGKKEKIKALGAQVLFIYPGEADDLANKAKTFMDAQRQFPSHYMMAIDEGFKWVEQFNLRWNAPNQTSYPSTFIVSKQGKIVYSHVSRAQGNRAKPSEIIGVLKSLSTKSKS